MLHYRHLVFLNAPRAPDRRIYRQTTLWIPFGSSAKEIELELEVEEQPDEGFVRDPEESVAGGKTLFVALLWTMNGELVTKSLDH